MTLCRGAPPVAVLTVIEKVVMPPSTGVDPDASEMETVGRTEIVTVTCAVIVPPTVAVTMASREVVSVR